MRKILFTLAAMFTILLAGSAWQANAQTTRGAATLSAQTQKFTPIEKAACGPHVGRYCGWFHHRVCRNGHCWCAPC